VIKVESIKEYMSDKLRIMKTKAVNNTKKPKVKASKFKFIPRPSDWVIIPLAILAAYAWVRAFTEPIDFRMGLFSVWYQNIIFHPGVAMIAIAVFCSLYIYRDISRKDVGKYARVIVYFFAILTVYYLIVQLNAVMASGASSTCTGLMGGQTNCAQVGQLYAYIYLLSPFSLLLWGALSTVGIIILARKTRREFKAVSKTTNRTKRN
jgi:hypothetical protein